MDAQPWPRLLARWQDGQLRSLLLHADGRRAHVREEAAADAAQLGPALADALAALHRPVQHAALVSDHEMAVDELRRRLGLATLCSVSMARAIRLEPDDASGWAGAARALHLALHTPASGAVCAQIRAAYAHLTRCEKRVADIVLANPSAALEKATARLAEAAQVSQPQVIRFCRALGFDGVKGLKRALAESLATGEDGPVGHPLLARSTQALRGLDRATLARAAATLADAGQVDVLADTAHAPLRDLALQALWRAGIPARALLPGELPLAAPAVWLALGAAAQPRTGAPGVWITATAQATAALQLVTGPEAELAPALLAAMALQLLLADVAASRRSRRRQACIA
jgi:Helix-turn-helix domain, rpiR family